MPGCTQHRLGSPSRLCSSTFNIAIRGASIDARKRNHYRSGVKARRQTWSSRSPPVRRSEDLGTKRGLYAFLGVKEYVLFDPREDYLKPRLGLFRLQGENFVPVVGDMRLATLEWWCRVVSCACEIR